MGRLFTIILVVTTQLSAVFSGRIHRVIRIYDGKQKVSSLKKKRPRVILMRIQFDVINFFLTFL